MIDDNQYAVYLHQAAIEALGPAITPFLSEGTGGPHILCEELDTGGALCEMVVNIKGADGRSVRTDVMLPVAMIRLVLSVGRIGDGFGFTDIT